MIVSPYNNVLVKIESKFVSSVSNALKMAALNPGVQINPADFVNVTGEVVAIPRKISDRYDYQGFSTKDIKVGDIAIFSYAVIFSFIEHTDGNATYKNVFWYKGTDYWKVDIQNLYGVIRDKKIIMVNGFCMVGNMSQPSLIVMPNSQKKTTKASTATLTHIGNNLEGVRKINAEPGDLVHYNPSKLIEYKINDKKFGILRQKDILGVEIGGYSYIS